MKNIYHHLFIFTFFFFSFYLKAQYCTNDARFTETEVFTNNQITSNIDVQYGSAIDYLGANKDLTLNVFFPKLTVDPFQKRPLIFLVHGGGFVQGAKEDLNEECKLFARRGFVAVTIDYRLGIKCVNDPLSYNKAVYRALQDANAAMRYVVSNATALKIDTSWIFIGGGSAGSGTIMGMAYTSQADINAVYPTFSAQLGLLSASTNTLTNQFSIKGIFNNWGAASKNFISNNILLPMVSFHGDEDPTADIDSSLDNSCPTSTISLEIYGSRTLHTLSLNQGVCNGLTVKIGGDHVIYDDNTAGRTFRVSRATCFFKSLFCNSCSSYYSIDSTIYPCSPTTAIKENIINKHISVFPNPTKDVFNIIGVGNLNALEVEVVNVYGQSILITKGTLIIDLSSYRSGLYFIKIKEDNEIIDNYRLIKQ